MDRSFTILPRMKRCNSLSQIEELTYQGRKRSTPKKIIPKPYRGRLSLGKKADATISSKIRRRRSNLQECMDEYDLYDEDDDYKQKETIPLLLLSPATSASTFHCLPVIERESSSSSVDSRSTSRLSSNELTTGVSDIQDSRSRLFEEIGNLLSDDRSAKTTKLTLNQKSGGSKIHEPIFTIGNKKEKHKYGDVLWLFLKAYFSGRETANNGQESTLEEDSVVCKDRSVRGEVLQKIQSFSALPFPIPDSDFIDPNYMRHLTTVRKKVNELLSDYWDHFYPLFPHHGAMYNDCQKKYTTTFFNTVDERVSVLNAWINTVDDLTDKIRALGEVFEVANLPDAENLWPRPLLPMKKRMSLKEARPVFRAYVGRSLTLKGMKRVLARVWDICETSVLKASILLKRQASYAEAAAPRDSLNSNELGDKYGDMYKYGMCNTHCINMNLPSFAPLFSFVLGIRMELVLEWLSIRATFELPIDSNMDVLTLETMFEDSGDCVQEAIQVKKHFAKLAQSTCPNGGKLDASEFDERLDHVFKKYLWYVSCWSRAMAEQLLLRDLFSRLETEFQSAITYARCIPSGLEHITNTFCSLVPQLLDTLVIQFWEENAENINEGFLLADESDNEEDEDGSRDNQSVLVACREYNRVIREAKDRSARIFSQIRGALSQLLDATAYNIHPNATMEMIATRLFPDHGLIELTNDSDEKVFLLTNETPSYSTDLKEFLDSIRNRKSTDKAHVIIIPGKAEKHFAKFRRVPLRLDNRMSICYLRIDYVCVLGNFPLHTRYSDLFQLALPACTSHDLLNEQLKELTSHLVSHLSIVWELIERMWSTSLEGCDTGKSRECLYSDLLKAFNFFFQLHRDVSRVAMDSYPQHFGCQLAIKGMEVAERWRDLVKEMHQIPSVHIPLWASHAFNFLHYITDTKWTAMLSEEQFQDLLLCVNQCRNLVLRADVLADTNNLRIDSSRRRTSSSSWNRRAKSKHMFVNKREHLSRAADNIDRECAKRRSVPVGRVIEKDHSAFELAHYVDPSSASIKAPFTWQMLGKIGAGSFGDVYKALHIEKNCVIAVKKLKSDRSMIKEVFKKKAFQEVDILRNFNHKNLVRFYGYEVHQDEILILMEYCAEGTLERVCRDGLDMSVVRSYTNSLLQAVEYMHIHKVVHRDIKPANIFLDMRCVLKLGDLGSAIRLRNEMTVKGELLDVAGTYQYMAPEVHIWGGEEADGSYRGYGRAIDIWSVGCVVLEMITGRKPWPDFNHFQIVLAVGRGHRPTYPSGSTKILQEFLDGCFEFDPEKRKTAEQLLGSAFANIHVDHDTVFTTFDLLPDIDISLKLE